MTETLIGTATVSGRDDVIATLVLAFRADPVIRWLYPEPRAYLQHFPGFVTALAGKAFERGSAHTIGGFDAVALWLPTGEAADEEALSAHVERTLPPAMHESVAALMERIDECHPQTPHWYLPFIGVDPAQRGRGLGSALLRHVTAVCDRDGVPAYLESSNPANVPLYERHGFAAVKELRAGDSPPLLPMLREPQ